MTIRRRYQIKLAICGLLVLAGVAAAWLATTMDSWGATYLNGFQVGVGAALALGGLVAGGRILYILVSPERLKREEIERGDERNRSLRRSAAAITLPIAAIALHALSIIFTLTGRREEGVLLLQVVFAGVAVYAVTYGILRRTR